MNLEVEVEGGGGEAVYLKNIFTVVAFINSTQIILCLNWSSEIKRLVLKICPQLFERQNYKLTEVNKRKADERNFLTDKIFL